MNVRSQVSQASEKLERKLGLEGRWNERRAAFLALCLALTAQAAWMFFNRFKHHTPWLSMTYPFEFAMPFILLVLTAGRIRWIASLLRFPVAIAFLQAVCDRLGFLGKPGTPGVAWGDFAHFVRYAGEVNSFMPPASIPVLAVMATIFESTCGVALLLGLRLRWAAAGSAALLFLFATAMTISGLSQFEYGVYAMSAGAWALSTVDASLVSVDAIVPRQKTVRN